jgi:rod shape determining protein RodA
MVLDRRQWHSIDWLTILGLVFASAFGLLVIYSATQAGPTPDLYKAQVARLLIGMALLGLVMIFDYHSIVDRAEVIYVSVLGPHLSGSLRGCGRAPTAGSSSASDAPAGRAGEDRVVVFLAKYYSAVRKNHLGSSEVLITGFFAGLPSCSSPSSPTSAPPRPSPSCTSRWPPRGVHTRLLVAGVIAVALALPLGWASFSRLPERAGLRVLDPAAIPRLGLQSIQSTIAVGSGGFREKAGSTGPRVSSSFCPPAHRFRIRRHGREFGFVGVSTVIILYLVIILSLDTARRSRDRLGLYLVFGVLSMFVFQTLYNLAMVRGSCRSRASRFSDELRGLVDACDDARVRAHLERADETVRELGKAAERIFEACRARSEHLRMFLW